MILYQFQWNNDFRFGLLLQLVIFNLVMEEKNNKQKQKESDSSSNHRPPVDGNKHNQQDKVPRKSKKDSINDKKKNKNKLKEESHIPNPNNAIINIIITASSPQQIISDPLNKAFKEISQKMAEHNLPYPLEKLLRIPLYIQVGGGNRIHGSFGHGTTYFKRPLLEGNYYIEFIFKQDKKADKKAHFQPSVRLGLCIHKFNNSFPLGYGESIGYKSIDGAIIYKGQTVHKGQPFKMGDLITIFVRMSPPYKKPDPTKISQDSSVSFYKNGTHIYSFKQLKQTFYCFGASTFNYSQVQFLTKASNKQIFAIGKNYFDCLKDPIPYKDLQQSGIFKI